MSNVRSTRVAYILSIAHGIDAWTYREIDYLTSKGVRVYLYPLRVRPGPYMPSRNWYCHKWNVFHLILNFIRVLVSSPRRLCLSLSHAIKYHGIGYLLIACDFVVSFRKNHIEIIHCVFGDHKFFVGYYCKVLSDLPLSVALYGYELKANPNWKLFKKSLPDADEIIVNCEYNLGLVRQIAGDQIASRSTLIRHVASAKNKEYIRILIVGGFVYRKGHDVLFEAVKILLRKYSNIKVWVAGYSGDVDIRKLAQEIGISESVEIFENIAENVLEILYQTCDIFCLPSRTVQGGVNEGFPVAILEAMAHGKPVIASNLSGIPELLSEKLVDEGDIDGVAEALEQYIQDEKKRIVDGQRNYQVVQAQCSLENINTLISIWQKHLKEI